MAGKQMYDSLIHVNSLNTAKVKEKKQIFPLTRWENVLGAPRTVTKETIENVYVGDYLLYTTDGYTMDNTEYANCFGDL